MNRSDDETAIASSDKALNTRQKSSISLILFGLCIFLFIPTLSVEIADYSNLPSQDEMDCGVERCQMKVSIVDLWACDYEGQNTDAFCTSDAKNLGTTIGILSLSISLLLIACCYTFFLESENNGTDYEQGFDKS